MLQKMVDRHTNKYPMVSQQLKDFLQVELDIGPLISCRSTGLGPSPLSSSSCPSSANSCITITAAGEMGKGQAMQWKMMRQRAEDALWLASAFFILFYGDFRSNFFSLLASDPRISRAPLLYGMACMLMNCIMLLLFLMTHPQLKRSSSLKKQEEYIIAAASTVFTLLALAAFVMLSIALWPVWYILTFPLLFTLFMALAVVSSYALPWSVLDANKDIWSFAFKA